MVARALRAITICIALTFAAPATAGPYEDAFAAHKRGDYATAVRILRPLAEQGDAAAQHNLGSFYAAGQGVPQDYAKAVKWWRKAAEQGFAGAQYILGFAYAKGQGVPQDYVEAVKWSRKAAEQGFALAQTNLGVAYSKGQGVPQDYAQAVRWFRKAAEQGDAADESGSPINPPPSKFPHSLIETSSPEN